MFFAPSNLSRIGWPNRTRRRADSPTSFPCRGSKSPCSAEDGRTQRASMSGTGIGLRTPEAARMFSITSRIPYRTWQKEADMGFLAWIVVGLIAGWLAGQVMRGGGYGVLVDIILGLVGGIVGGWVFGLLGIWPGGGMIGS